MSYPNTAPLLGTATVTSVAAAVVATGTAIVTGLEAFASLACVATVVGQAGSVLDVYVQTRHGAGDWVDVAHFPQLGIGAVAVTYRVPLSRRGTVAAPVVVGTNAAPALAANAIVQGELGDAVRLACVGGALGAGGAAQSMAVYATASPLGSNL